MSMERACAARRLAIPLRLTVALVVSLLIALMRPALADQCYLEGGSCALCWITDSAGVRDGPRRCPDSISSRLITDLPATLYSMETSEVRYELRVNTTAFQVVPVPDSTGKLWEITHSNMHSCFSGAGICTPFISDSPGISTHTPEKTSQLDSEGRAEFDAKVQLEEGFYMIIGHSRFHVLDDGVAEPRGGCGDKDCLKVYDVAFGLPRQALPADDSPSRRCFLRVSGPQEDCSLCWITDSSGARRLEVCPEELVAITQDNPPPEVMVSGEPYKTFTTLKLDKASLGLVQTDSSSGLVDIVHANYHSCRAKAGACTPFVSDTPGLSTHSPATSGNLDADGQLYLNQDMNLSPGKYTIISHFRFHVTEGNCSMARRQIHQCPVTTYDIAFGSNVHVLPRETLKAFARCREGDPCMLCWVNDWQGRTRVLSPCPSGILPAFVEPPPEHLFAGSSYNLRYALELDAKKLGVVQRVGDHRGDGSGFVAAMLMACPSGSTTCGPLLAHNASNMDMSLPGEVTSRHVGRVAFKSSISLPAGGYTLIAHYQFYATEGGEADASPCIAEGQQCLLEYNAAVGVGRKVLELPTEALEASSGTLAFSTGALVGVVGSAVALLAAAVAVFAVMRARHNGSSCCGSGTSLTLAAQGDLVINVAPGGTLTVKQAGLKNSILRHTTVKDTKNLTFGNLSQPVVDLHEGLEDEFRNMPMRLLLASHVRSAKALLCYEQLTEKGTGFLDVPYSRTTDKEIWDKAAVISWRWSKPKPAKMQRGFSPLSDMQLAELQGYLEVNKKIDYVWLDWSCVPQHLSSPMLEIARSKLFYSRARTMLVLPAVQELPYGNMRVVLMSIIRALSSSLAASPPSSPKLLCKVADRAGITRDLAALPELDTCPPPAPPLDSTSFSGSPHLRFSPSLGGFATSNRGSQVGGGAPMEPFDSVKSVQSSASSTTMSRQQSSLSSASSSIVSRQQSFLAADFLAADFQSSTSTMLDVAGRRASASTDSKTAAAAAAAAQCNASSGPCNAGSGPKVGEASQWDAGRREDVVLACHTLMQIRDRGAYSDFGYFGRVWTLAERMARHGRKESLRNWLNLEAWLGMTLDALWQASDPAINAEDELPGLTYCWGRIFDADKSREVIAMLRHVRERGSNLASDSVAAEVAELFVDAVQVWRTAFVTEALDIAWLRNYLLRDAGRLYQSWHPEDKIFALYTFFCWHVRRDFPSAHRDLCLLAGIEERESVLWPVAEQFNSLPDEGDDAPEVGTSPYKSNKRLNLPPADTPPAVAGVSLSGPTAGIGGVASLQSIEESQMAKGSKEKEDVPNRGDAHGSDRASEPGDVPWLREDDDEGHEGLAGHGNIHISIEDQAEQVDQRDGTNQEDDGRDKVDGSAIGDGTEEQKGGVDS